MISATSRTGETALKDMPDRMVVIRSASCNEGKYRQFELILEAVDQHLRQVRE